MNWTLLINTLALGLGTVLGAGLLGWGAALLHATLNVRGRRVLQVAAVMALLLPAFLQASFWMHLAGPAGGLPRAGNLLKSVAGVALVLSLIYWPIPYFLIVRAWRGVPASCLELDPVLHDGRLFRYLLWPACREVLVPAGVVVLALALNQFLVPAVLQTPVWSAEVWIRFNTAFDPLGAWILCWPLALLPLAWLILARRFSVGALAGPSGEEWFGRRFRARLSRGWRLGILAGAAGPLLGAILPCLWLLGRREGWMDLPDVWATGGAAVRGSLSLALGGAGLALGLGAFTSRRAWAREVVWLPFLFPGVFLGILLLQAGHWVSVAGVGSVLLALAVRYGGLGREGWRWGGRACSRELQFLAVQSGASPWRRFRDLWLPLAGPGVAWSGYVIYLLVLWDVETLVFILPPGWETLSMRIFNLLHYGYNTQVEALCLLLLIVALAPLALAALVAASLRRWAGRGWWMALGVMALGSSGCRFQAADAAVEALGSRFFAATEIVGTRGTGPGQFNKPRSLALDAEDRLYVVDMTGRVQKFDTDGTFLDAWQMPETDRGRPKGMCLDQEGRIVVVEPHYSRVNHFLTDGTLDRQWGGFGREEGQLGFPRAAVAGADWLAVSEYSGRERVQLFSAKDGHFIRAWGGAGRGPGELNRPEGLGVDAQGRIYVADSCNHRVQVFDVEGHLFRVFGRAGQAAGELSYPYDVCVDAAGWIYVCEFGNSRIQVFDPEGRSVEIFGRPGGGPGELNNPWSLALDSIGHLYVADSRNHRVVKFLRRPDGTRHARVLPLEGGEGRAGS